MGHAVCLRCESFEYQQQMLIFECRRLEVLSCLSFFSKLLSPVHILTNVLACIVLSQSKSPFQALSSLTTPSLEHVESCVANGAMLEPTSSPVKQKVLAKIKCG